MSGTCRKCGAGPICGPRYELEDELSYWCATCGYTFTRPCVDRTPTAGLREMLERAAQQPPQPAPRDEGPVLAHAPALGLYAPPRPAWLVVDRKGECVSVHQDKWGADDVAGNTDRVVEYRPVEDSQHV